MLPSYMSYIIKGAIVSSAASSRRSDLGWPKERFIQLHGNKPTLGGCGSAAQKCEGACTCCVLRPSLMVTGWLQLREASLCSKSQEGLENRDMNEKCPLFSMLLA